MTPQQCTWRNLSWLGIFFSVAVVNGFLGNAVLFGLTAETLESGLQNNPQPLFPNASSAQSPLILIYVIVVGLPFTLCSLFHLTRCRAFISSEFPILFGVIQGFSQLSLAMGFMINIFFTISELYTPMVLEARLSTQLNVTAVYFYIWAVGIAGVVFGVEMWRNRRVPPWLALITIFSNASAVILHSLAQNPDFPAFRLILGLPLVSLDVIVWAFFLWLASSAENEKTTLITKPK